ncbi:hypothetical protein C6N75_03095, partial [Streptomyces solincola]
AALPTYAFQRERFWSEPPREAGDAGALGLDASPHTWLGAVTPLADGESHLITGRLSREEHPWLGDHVLFGETVVPGTGLLELATAAAHEVGADSVAELTLAEPLVVNDPVRLQLSVGAPDQSGRRPITIHSRPESAPAGTPWRRHASGALRDTAPAATPADDEAFAALATGWPAAGAEAVDPAAVYADFTAQGIDYGPAFRGLTGLCRTGGAGYAAVRLPDPGAGADYHLHPALLDTALHTMKAVTSGRGEPEGALLPFEWTDVRVYAVGSGELRVRVEVEPGEAGQTLTLWAADSEGRPVARIGGLSLRRATADRLRAALTGGAEDLHRLDFTPVPDDATRGAATAELVLNGDGRTAEALGAEQITGLDALTERLGVLPAAPARVVVDMTGLPPIYSAPEAAYKATEHTLMLLQGLLAEERLSATELVWLTRGSVAAADGDTLEGLAYAALWGLLRCARTEHPERRLRLVDIGPGPVDPTALRTALAVTGEPELAVREGAVRAARLLRAEPAAAPATGASRALDPDGTVLVTGGTGELGREVARNLVRRHGVRHLVLTSRQGPDAPGADELVRTLTDDGAVSVRIVACDASRRDALARVVALADPAHPWTGVFHLAGILDDGIVTAQTSERLSRVMAPKVRGAHYLAELTAGCDLAALVFFSSAAGTVGSAGQSVYAAANSYLDALAAKLRATGRPATSLAWGLWQQAGIGLTAALGRAEIERLRRQGIAPLPFDTGLRLLDAVLARPAANFVPARLDLAAARRELDQGRPAPALYRALVRPPLRRAAGGGVRQEPAAAPQGLRERLLAVAPDRRGDLTVDLVLGEVATVLGLDGPGALAPDQVLKDLGLDSLMAVELRRRLSGATGLTLPATLAFDHPTPEHIARLIVTRMEPAAAALPVPAAEERSVAELSAELDAFLAEAGLDDLG